MVPLTKSYALLNTFGLLFKYCKFSQLFGQANYIENYQIGNSRKSYPCQLRLEWVCFI